MTRDNAAPQPPNASVHGIVRVNRRVFLAQAALVAAGVVASGCGNGQIGPDMVTAPDPNGTEITVSDFPDLATVGALVKVSTFVAVKRTGDSSFAAYSMVCTHQGCLINLQSNAFACPCHGSQFDASGRVTHGPANQPLVQYATSYDVATDVLTIG